MTKIPAHHISHIQDHYRHGVSCSELASWYGVSRSHMSQVISGKRRSHGYSAPKMLERKGYVFNQDYFKNIDSEDKAYFLGLIAADGCIYKSGKGNQQAVVCLKLKDKKILDKFLKVLKHNGNVTTSSTLTDVRRVYYQVRLTSNKMASHLRKYGIDQDKTVTLRVYPELLSDEMQRHFWRGFVDGDGSLSFDNTYDYYRFDVCGLDQVMWKFKEYLETHLDINLKVGKYRKDNLYLNGVVYTRSFDLSRLQAGGSTADKIIEHLYSACSFYLERKMKIAKEVIS